MDVIIKNIRLNIHTNYIKKCYLEEKDFFKSSTTRNIIISSILDNNISYKSYIINNVFYIDNTFFVDITIEVLKKFGVEIEKTDYGFSINPQKFTSPGEITVEGDWSNAAFWIAADEICGNVKINGMNYDSIQGDKRILEDKKSIEIDAREIPDLVPILSVIALARKGRTKIFNAERLRIKESDRITAICKSLGALGADIEELSDGLIINGTGTLKGGICAGFNDHRIVMSAAIASLISTDSVTIKGAEAVNKSYPRFFDDFKALGGKIVIE